MSGKDYRFDKDDEAVLAATQEDGFKKWTSKRGDENTRYINDHDHNPRNLQVISSQGKGSLDNQIWLHESPPVGYYDNGAAYSNYDEKTQRLTSPKVNNGGIISEYQWPEGTPQHSLNRMQDIGGAHVVPYDRDAFPLNFSAKKISKITGQTPQFVTEAKIGTTIHWLDQLAWNGNKDNKAYLDLERSLDKQLKDYSNKYPNSDREVAGVTSKEILHPDNELRKQFIGDLTESRTQGDVRSAKYAAEQVGKIMKSRGISADEVDINIVFGGEHGAGPNDFNEHFEREMKEQHGVDIKASFTNIQEEDLRRNRVSGLSERDMPSFYTLPDGKLDYDASRQAKEGYVDQFTYAKGGDPNGWGKSHNQSALSAENALKTLKAGTAEKTFPSYVLDLIGKGSEFAKDAKVRPSGISDGDNLVLALASKDFTADDAKRITQALNEEYPPDNPDSNAIAKVSSTKPLDDPEMAGGSYQVEIDIDRFNKEAYPDALKYVSDKPEVKQHIDEVNTERYTSRALAYIESEQDKYAAELEAGIFQDNVVEAGKKLAEVADKTFDKAKELGQKYVDAYSVPVKATAEFASNVVKDASEVAREETQKAYAKSLEAETTQKETAQATSSIKNSDPVLAETPSRRDLLIGSAKQLTAAEKANAALEQSVAKIEGNANLSDAEKETQLTATIEKHLTPGVREMKAEIAAQERVEEFKGALDAGKNMAQGLAKSATESAEAIGSVYNATLGPVVQDGMKSLSDTASRIVEGEMTRQEIAKNSEILDKIEVLRENKMLGTDNYRTIKAIYEARQEALTSPNLSEERIAQTKIVPESNGIPKITSSSIEPSRPQTLNFKEINTNRSNAFAVHDDEYSQPIEAQQTETTNTSMESSRPKTLNFKDINTHRNAFTVHDKEAPTTESSKSRHRLDMENSQLGTVGIGTVGTSPIQVTDSNRGELNFKNLNPNTNSFGTKIKSESEVLDGAKEIKEPKAYNPDSFDPIAKGIGSDKDLQNAVAQTKATGVTDDLKDKTKYNEDDLDYGDVAAKAPSSNTIANSSGRGIPI